MASLLSASALVLSLAAVALGCAVPHDGCIKDVCDSYRDLVLDDFVVPLSEDPKNPQKWQTPATKLLGYYLGDYNPTVNGGSYNRQGIKGTPALNLERFDLETKKIDPSTKKPYAKLVSAHSSLTECCYRCAQADGCALWQFFPEETPSSYAPPNSCYLLTGGTQTWDFPEKGTPLAGSHRKQIGPRAKIPLSFVGGRCNYTGGTVDDPHFTGARGTHFDFNGEVDKTFAILSDASVHVNGVFKGYQAEAGSLGPEDKGLRTWIREAGFLWKDEEGKTHSLHMVARDGKEQRKAKGFLTRLAIDDMVLAEPTRPGMVAQKGGMTLEFMGTSKPGILDVDYYKLKIGNVLDMSVSVRAERPSLQRKDQAEVHFNLLLNSIKTTDAVHGVLGQTFRNTPEQEARALKFQELTRVLNKPVEADGKTGEGFLDGKTADYQTSSVTSADCKFCVFGAASVQ